jgi:subtilisin family serine protease
MLGRAAFRIARVWLAAALAVVAFAEPGFAATRLDAEFVALLSHRGPRRHPLADRSGRLPLVLEVLSSNDARSLGWLPLAPGLATVRVAPDDLPRFVDAHRGARFSIWPSLHLVLDASARLNRVDAYRATLAAKASPVAGTGRGVVVGIVDTGVDATHPDFRDATGKTRIAWMLDFARAPLGLHAEMEDALGCTSANQSRCAVLDAGDIDTALAGEGALLTRDPVGHGTHVASIAAGNGGGDARFVGGAPEATLIVASVAQSDGGVTLADVDIVSATRFIFERAEAMGMPAVVNLSLGGDFGPHDGTTPIEVALAAMVGPAHPGRSIVVAAGNSGTLYRGDGDQVLGIHSETRVTNGAPAKLTVLTPDARQGDDLSGTAYVWIKYGAGDAVSVGLTGAQGLSIRPVPVGQKAGFRAKDDALTAGIYNGVTGAESPLPASSHGAVIVWDGTWQGSSKMTILLEGEGFVEAWVEATFDDPLAAGSAFFDVATRAGTINLPASHPALIAVGCTINRTQWVDRDLASHDIAMTRYASLSPEDGSCYFSSAGPTATGATKPDLSAPGAMVAAAMSRDADPALSHASAFTAPSGLCPAGNECLAVDGGHALLSGSSMASPQVAGAIALLFERNARLTQAEILRWLQSGARRPVGPVTADYVLGAGALDVAGAMAAFEADQSPIVREPDATASWLSLANSYLHPGGGPALAGLVQVRAADGSIADGFDERRLTVEFGEEAMLDEPLTRTSAGLYRFAVRARPSTGTRFARLEVKLDGIPIGAAGSRLSGDRLVPIGADRWIASGAARVYGGCNVTAASPALRPDLGIIVLAGWATRRYRRRPASGSGVRDATRRQTRHLRAVR